MLIHEVALRMHDLTGHVVQEWKIRRLEERGLIPKPKRSGRVRIYDEHDLPEIQRALESAGWLPVSTNDTISPTPSL